MNKEKIEKLYKLKSLSGVDIRELTHFIDNELKQQRVDTIEEVREGVKKPFKIIEDFVERWNKQDREKDVAQAIQDISNKLN